jgi:hypothetical protein
MQDAKHVSDIFGESELKHSMLIFMTQKRRVTLLYTTQLRTKNAVEQTIPCEICIDLQGDFPNRGL